MGTGTFRMRAVSIAATVGLVMLFTTQTAHAAIGDLDPTFGTGGTVRLGQESAVEVQVQKDGRVLIVDRAGDVWRLDPSGALDVTYGGGDGVASTDMDAQAAALRGDGRLVVLGTVDGAMALERLTSNGVPDSTFGGDGRIVRPATAPSFEANDLALGRHGRIYVAGGSVAGGLSMAAVVAYNTHGRVLRSFGVNGLARYAYQGRSAGANALAVQADGHIVIVGWFYQDPDPEYPVPYRSGAMRLLSDGRLDPSFGVGGREPILIEEFAGQAHSVVVSPTSGEIWVSGIGRAPEAEGHTGLDITRLSPAGAIQMESSVGEGPNATLVLSGNKVWLVGTAQVEDPPGWRLARLAPSGGGAFEQFGGWAWAASGAIRNGSLYVAGTLDLVSSGTGDWSGGLVARFTA